MKTSMTYRTFRLYFNNHADNFDLFGNRVYSPLNGKADKRDQNLAAVIRLSLIATVLAAIAAIIFL